MLEYPNPTGAFPIILGITVTYANQAQDTGPVVMDVYLTLMCILCPLIADIRSKNKIQRTTEDHRGGGIVLSPPNYPTREQ
ncbi:hypothetical protein SAMN04488556_3451 [Halostagnicola kamekurae]|uniref:Uncharacterized protein n=1 Tax=Halostagnicola kamekurae TaxID=619731 RepID=A0A1I6TUP6_9EURY|nr:hypothetical protein SAMN04488556_3451 [Halostagnicola kamekurae]